MSCQPLFPSASPSFNLIFSTTFLCISDHSQRQRAQQVLEPQGAELSVVTCINQGTGTSLPPSPDLKVWALSRRDARGAAGGVGILRMQRWHPHGQDRPQGSICMLTKACLLLGLQQMAHRADAEMAMSPGARECGHSDEYSLYAPCKPDRPPMGSHPGCFPFWLEETALSVRGSLKSTESVTQRPGP